MAKRLFISAVLLGIALGARAQIAVQSTSPGFVIAGSGAQSVSIIGSGFAPETTAAFNGAPHALSYVSPTTVSISLTPDDQATFGIDVITLTNPDGTTTSYNLPVLLVPPGMLQNSQLSMGDPSRLEGVIQKGLAGLPITIAAIGGGFTYGSEASTPSHNYLQQFKNALNQMFPASTITLVNAGIGSTASDYGSLRLSNDVMAYQPDLVIVEFAENDRQGGSAAYGATFEGLIRQLDLAPSQPAVIVLMMMGYLQPFTAANDTAEPWQAPIGQLYSMPMVSYYDAINPELLNGDLQVSQLSADAHYPNDLGYAYITLFLQTMMQNVAALTPTPVQTLSPPAPLYNSTFEFTSLAQGIGGMGPPLNPTASFKFVPQPGFVNPLPCRAPEGYESSTPGSTIDFTVSGTDVLVGYWSCYGPMGRANAYVDGVLYPHVLDGWFSIPGGYERKFAHVATGLAPGPHKVHVVLLSSKNPSSTGTTFRVLAVGTGGPTAPGQVVPTITWPTPAAISYGTALGAAQLNAQANTLGTFTYNYPSGPILNAGSYTLTATFTPVDQANIATVSVSVPLTVSQVVPVVSWPAPAPIPYGTPLDGTEFNAVGNVPGTFTYSYPLGTILAAGSYDLMAIFTPDDLVNYAPVAASVPLTVTQAVPVIRWPAPNPISYGTALSWLQLGARASAPGTFTFNFPPGTVLNAGSYILTAAFTPADPADFTAASASVPLMVNQAVPMIWWSPPAAISYGTGLSDAQLSAQASAAGTFEYNFAPGSVLAVGSYTLSATFTPSDQADYTTASASVPLTVNQAVPLITWPAPAPISYGTALSGTQLNAQANTAGTFAYSLAPGAVLNAGSYTLSATFTPADLADYTAASASVPLTVNQAVPVITWATPAAITYGTALDATQLNATASVPGTFNYDPGFGAVPDGGANTLGSTFTPSDKANYTTASASVSLTVNQAVPVVTWATPASVMYGTPLSSAQLNASANVPGTFVYSPGAGTVLNTGVQALNATFNPASANDYASVTTQTSLQVTPAMPVIQWQQPAPVTMDTPLTQSAFSVSAGDPTTNAPVAGTFAFSPVPGTQFSVPGPQELDAVFTPTDTVNYTGAQASSTIMVLPPGIVCWGDAMTVSYPGILSKLISLPVVGQAVPSQTSTQIGVREGGIATQVTVAGGAIPQIGGVGVTFTTGYEPVTSFGPANGIGGTIAGVHGIVTYTAGGLVFTRSQAGDITQVPAPVAFQVDTPYSLYLPVFWEGQSDSINKSVTVSNLAGQVAAVADGQDYIVFALMNSANQWMGKPWYQQIISANNQLANLYGLHFIDVRSQIVNAYDATSLIDVSDFQHDVPPTSLRAVSGVGALPAAVDPTTTNFTVKLTKGTLLNGHFLTIDSGSNAENVLITAVSGSTVTVVRAMAGNAVAHSAAAPVVETDAVNLNAAGYTIIAKAVASYLAKYQLAAH